MTNTQHSDEAQLLAGMRSGDMRLFRQAVISYTPVMLATARRLVGSADADDVVQEAWLSAYQQIEGFEGRSKLSTWLCRIVSNTAISALRRRKKDQSLDAIGAEDASSEWFDSAGHWSNTPGLWNPGSPQELLDATELQHCIDRHLDKMPDKQRQVVMLRDIQQSNFPDICNAVGLSASNVRVMLHRGRMKLLAMVNTFQETGTC